MGNAIEPGGRPGERDEGSGAAALGIAERLFAAIEAGDLEAASEIYAPDAEVWHSYDGVVQSREDSLRVLGWVTRNLQVRYTDVRRSATATGFVQQHMVRATAGDGRVVEVPACIVATCRGGRITRLDEYLDSAHVAAVLRLVQD